MHKTHYILIQIAALLLAMQIVTAQAAWIEPDPTSADFDPTTEVTIYIDANQTECPDLANFDQVFMWTWSPNELAAGEVNANGEWGASNPNLMLTPEGAGIFSYTMIPTEFYQVDAATVYENDFSFLIKLADGAGGMTTCAEDKSEDLEVLSEPFVFERKVYSFPDAIKDTLAVNPDDYFTLIYNSNLESDSIIRAAGHYNVFLKVVDTDGRTYTYAPPTQLDNFDELKMRDNGDGTYLWTVRPSDILIGGNQPLPADREISHLRLQIAKTGARTGGDLVAGTYDYYYICK